MKEAAMAVTAVILHRVKDYDAWREIYDGFADVQKAGGVTHESVHRAKDDPNYLLVIHGFADVAAAETFLASAELRETMERAGVEGQPDIKIYEDA
jgi:quinol monooxygenase YgiN